MKALIFLIAILPVFAQAQPEWARPGEKDLYISYELNKGYWWETEIGGIVVRTDALQPLNTPHPPAYNPGQRMYDDLVRALRERGDLKGVDLSRKSKRLLILSWEVVPDRKFIYSSEDASHPPKQ